MYESTETEELQSMKTKLLDLFSRLEFIDACEHSLDDTSGKAYCHMLLDAAKTMSLLADISTETYRAGARIAEGIGVSYGQLKRARSSDYFHETLDGIKALYNECCEVASEQGWRE